MEDAYYEFLSSIYDEEEAEMAEMNFAQFKIERRKIIFRDDMIAVFFQAVRTLR